jgi:hypothetical protein
MKTPSAKTSAAKNFKTAASGVPPKLAEEPIPAQAAVIDEDEDNEAFGGVTTEVEYVQALVTMKPGSSVIVDVPEWELDVLREIHGPEAVQYRASHFVDYPYNAAQALQYLKNKYKAREQEDIIKRLYPRVRDFAKSTGLPYRPEDEANSQMQKSEVINNTLLRTERRSPAPAKAGRKEQGAAGSGASGSAGA